MTRIATRLLAAVLQAVRPVFAVVLGADTRYFEVVVAMILASRAVTSVSGHEIWPWTLAAHDWIVVVWAAVSVLGAAVALVGVSRATPTGRIHSAAACSPAARGWVLRAAGLLVAALHYVVLSGSIYSASAGGAAGGTEPAGVTQLVIAAMIAYTAGRHLARRYRPEDVPARHLATEARP